MLYPIYASIKARLTDQVAAIKAISWYNNQYKGIKVIDSAVLVEFPDPLNIEAATKTTDRTDLTIKIHYLTKCITDVDGTIPDAQVEAHETEVAAAIAALKHHQLLTTEGALIGRPLQHTKYQSIQDYEGWLVTWLTFTTKLTL
jgi:hypothetical protein